MRIETMGRANWFRTAALLAMAVVPAELPAQSLRFPATVSGLPAEATRAVPASPEFGTQDLDVLEVQAYAFQAGDSSDRIVDDGKGARYFAAAPTAPFMAAAVQLPAGVFIDAIGMAFCTAAPGDLVATLWDDSFIAGPAPANLGSFTAPGPGCGVGGAFVNYQYGGAGGHPLYIVVSWPGSDFTGATKFNNVYIRYRRVVSPAPAMATFSDVPTTSPQFKFVEALAAAGITAGCGGGNYCPDQPITRGQMAVFLATALGLHWPN